MMSSISPQSIRRIAQAAGIALLTIPLLGAASVPDPDHTFYGLPTDDGALLEDGQVVVRRPGGGAVLATYRLGAREEYGGRYVLRVPMELGPTVTGAAARTGDEVEFYIDDVLAGEGEVGDPGETTSLNLELQYAHPPLLWVEPLDVAEGNAGTVGHDITVRLSRAVGGSVTFAWATVDGTAVAGPDYLAASGLGTIGAGEVETTVRVSVLGETLPEPSESFTIVLSNLVGAEFRPSPDGSQAEVRILADDTEWIASVEDSELVEGDVDTPGSVRVVIEAGYPTEGGSGVSVDWELVSDTALEGEDFAAAAGTLVIDTSTNCPDVGLPCGVIQPQILGDLRREGDEQFLVRLTAVSAGSIGRADATFTIIDDERYLRYVGATVSDPGLVDGLQEPTAVALSPDGLHLYAASSLDDSVSVFTRDGVSGALGFVEAQVQGLGGVSGLDGASAVVVSPDGLNLYATGLFSDSVAVFGRNPTTGSLTFLESHANGVSGVTGLDGATAVIVSADGLHLYTAARNSNAVGHFTRNPATGALTFVSALASGAGAPFIQGANALALSPSGDHLFLTASVDSTISAFARNPTTGALTAADVERDGVNDPSDPAGIADGLNGARSVAVAPDGLHVYVAGELEDSISVFAFDSGSGELRYLERKRNGVAGVTGIEGVAALAAHPNGRFVVAAARGGAAVTVLRRAGDGRLTWFETRRNGELEAMPDTRVAGLGGAVGLASVPGTADHVYVGGQLDAAIAVFAPDNTAPLAPTAISTTHMQGGFSQLTTIGFEWSGASDSGVGLAGYSHLLDQVPASDPPLPITVPHGDDPHEHSDGPLADGLWYFHLKTCDVVDHCTTEHLGPYGIDTVAPAAPTNLQKTNPPEPTIAVSWDAAIDPGVQPSGIAGYVHEFSQDPAATCAGSPTLPNTATAVTSGTLADGFWYFHICAVDGVDLRSPIATLGPLVADSGLSLQIDRVTAVAPPADDSVDGLEDLGMTQLRFDFNRPVALEGPGNGLDLSHYIVVDLGDNDTLDTVGCTTVGGDDEAVAMANATWVPVLNRLYLQLDGTTAVPAGNYTLRVCDSLVDYVGRLLDGDSDGTSGTNFVRAFEIAESNLLENPNVDAGLDHWTPSSPTDVFAQSLDAHDAPTSGSLRLQNDSGGPGATLGASQCVSVLLGGDYHLAALARIEDPDGGELSFGASLRVYPTLDCTGPPASAPFVSNTLTAPTSGLWQPVVLDVFLPTAGVSATPGQQVGLLVDFAVTVGAGVGESGVGVDVDAMTLTFQPDSVAPLAPTAFSTTHTAGGFSQLATIGFEWSGASDAGVGVEGYAVLVDALPATTPSLPVSIPHGADPHTISSGALADGQWYFHLAACDYLDNCSTVQHLGPYGIDTVAPSAPTNLLKTNPPEPTIEVSWTAAVDPGTAPSGLAGYVHEFSQDASASCSGPITLSAATTTASSGTLADGFWYFHICAVDGVDLRSPLATLGPLVADSGIPLQVERLSSVSITPDDSVSGREAVGMTQLRLDLNRPVALVGGGNAFDLANYQLVGHGDDGVLDTSDCTSLGGDDVSYEIASVEWLPTDNQLYLVLTDVRAVPAGIYSFRTCDSLVDYTGDALDGDADGSDGADFVRSFAVSHTNRLANPNIDQETLGWLLSSTTDIFGQDLDVDDTPTSGSLRLQNDTGGPNAVLEVSQCVAAIIGQRYRLSALVRVDNSDGGSVAVGASVTPFSDTSCTGPQAPSVLSTTVEVDTAGAWLPIAIAPYVPRLTPGISSDFGLDAGLLVRFMVAVGPEATQSWVGVDLDEAVFALIPPLFASGFETGDASEWSATVP